MFREIMLFIVQQRSTVVTAQESAVIITAIFRRGGVPIQDVVLEHENDLKN